MVCSSRIVIIFWYIGLDIMHYKLIGVVIRNFFSYFFDVSIEEVILLPNSCWNPFEHFIFYDI